MTKRGELHVENKNKVACDPRGVYACLHGELGGRNIAIHCEILYI